MDWQKCSGIKRSYLVFWRGYLYFLRVTIYENLHNKGNCDRKFNGNITQLLIRMGGR
ncbi:Uncharacterised protein [Shigella dysenteriae]|nr:putative chaperone domain protein [Shigella boydii 965-58]VDG91951.1 Uncharacterised protein [Shigella dysenteriae]